jgi:hypothetical protein
MMNWDALAAIAETIAALTVLVTLLFVVKQLKVNNAQAEQANQIARADSQRDILKQVADHSTLAIANAELQSDIRACYQDWEHASSDAKWNFESWASVYFYIVEQAIYMHDEGLLSDATYYAMEAGAIRIVQTPGGSQWWSHKSRHIGSDVSERINRRQREIGSSLRPMFGLPKQSET